MVQCMADYTKLNSRSIFKPDLLKSEKWPLNRLLTANSSTSNHNKHQLKRQSYQLWYSRPCQQSFGTWKNGLKSTVLAPKIYIYTVVVAVYIYIYTPFSQEYTDGAHMVELKLIDVSLGASAILFTLYSGDPIGD